MKILERIAWTIVLALAGFWIAALPVPLTGAHQWRQADTLISAYYYCTESLDFGRPHVAARGETSGIAVGEFPVYSYLDGLICKAEGHWSEVTPKLLNMFFLILAIVLWFAFLQMRFGRKPNDKFFWLVAFALTPLHLTFLTIPMPEASALCAFGLAAYLWEKSKIKNDKTLDVLAALAFILGFMIRPYHIYLLFFLAPSVKRMAFIFPICVAGFFLWYRWWAGQVTTLPGYFGINFASLREILKALPDAIMAIPNRIFDQTAIIGLWPMFLIARRQWLLALGFLASWGTMIALKADHLQAHSYYLMNAGIFASLLIYLGLREMKPKFAGVVASLIVVFSVSDVFHHFLPNREWPDVEKIVAAQKSLNPEGPVVTYMGSNPKWLYYLKTIGLRREPEEFHGANACPAGMRSYLREDESHHLEYGLCQETAKPAGG